jgi:hypothetical protein
MEILINGQKADIILEREKTVGEVLAGLEQWLADTGHRLSGLVIDGETVGAGRLDVCFDRDLGAVKTLNLITSSMAELIAESLLRLYGDSLEYEGLAFEEKQRFFAEWNESPQARLLAEQIPEHFALCAKTFSGGEFSPRLLCAITEERLREFRDPPGELARLEPLVNEVCGRLEELPLDIQTGKDSRAVETVRIFSGVAEKVFRLFKVLGTGGFAPEEITLDEMPVSDYITEFSAAVKELLAAYEQRDAVLVGDLAEYEMAPRLRRLYAAINRLVEVRE